MNKILQCGLLMSMLAALSSCRDSDIKMHTIIHADGSCVREVSYRNVMPKAVRDSLWGEGKTGWSWPMPECLNVDAFCKTCTEVGAGDTVTTTFSCPFRSVEEMCEQTPLTLNGTRLKSHATLKRRFRWFYTDYTFREVFTCVGDTFKIPATQYADKDIVSYWFTGYPTLTQGMSGAEAAEMLREMEPKIDRWLNDNLAKTCLDYIVAHYEAISNPPVSKERFIGLQDSLIATLLRHDDLLSIQPQDEFLRFFGSDAYAPFFDEETPLGDGLQQVVNERLDILWFSVPYTLTMPGTITDAGTGVVQGSTIFYPFTGERLIPGDYVISAQSRRTNLWAYILTALIILVAIVSHRHIGANMFSKQPKKRE